MLEIITHPNPILKQRARKLGKEEIAKKETQKLIDEMIETMKTKNGIGLAAPQIGQSVQIIVVQKNDKAKTFINPKIVNRSWRKETIEEGCLSIPEVYCDIKRSKKIKVKTLDKNGKLVTFSAKGLFARVLQHEIEHLKGILIIDKQEKCEKPPRL